MEKRVTGIVDLPIRSLGEDRLKMRAFEKALSEFIWHTDTPMTIAIQGEWGSGKTSLMNRLSDQLCDPPYAPFYGVWLNTWHYSLLNDEAEILAEIIRALIDEVVRITRKEHPEKLKRLIGEVHEVSRLVFRGLSKVAIKTTLSQLNSEAALHVDDAFFPEDRVSRTNLNELRQTLASLIRELVAKNREQGVKKRTFLFFIDDLDRIEPAVAVKILELLKNIFEIQHCVFVLAIDYDVVVNGLRPKFGPPDRNNEREFRSFFDKIIQLPFRMPVQSFVIDDFLRDSLLSIGVISEEESRDGGFLQTLAELARLTVGTNPRSLKRLANSLSFINLLMMENRGSGGEELSSLKRQISFGLVCLQIAFPEIYNLLALNADFPHWTEEFARSQGADRSALEGEEHVLRHSALGTEWQRIIYVVCSRRPHLAKHTYNIIRTLERMRELSEGAGANVTDLLSDVFEFSSITNVKTESRPKLDINHVRVLFALNEKLLPLLQKKLRPPLTLAERSGRMVAKVTYRFEEKKGDQWVSVYVDVRHNNLLLTVGNQVGLFPVEETSRSGLENVRRKGKMEYFNQLYSGFLDLEDRYPAFTLVRNPDKGLVVKKGIQSCEVHFQTYVEAVETLYTSRFTDALSDFIIDYMVQSYQMSRGDWEG